MRRIVRFIGLPFGEKRLFWSALLVSLLVRVGLTFFSFARLSRMAEPRMPGTEMPDWDSIRSVVRSVRTASRYVPRANCLVQALTARFLLIRRGQSADLKIGVDKESEKDFGAHAWLEVEGEIIIGKLAKHDTRFARLESQGPLAV